MPENEQNQPGYGSPSDETDQPKFGSGPQDIPAWGTRTEIVRVPGYGPGQRPDPKPETDAQRAARELELQYNWNSSRRTSIRVPDDWELKRRTDNEPLIRDESPFDMLRSAGAGFMTRMSDWVKPLVYVVGGLSVVGLIAAGIKASHLGFYMKPSARDLVSASKSAGDARGSFKLVEEYDHINYGGKGWFSGPPGVESTASHPEQRCHVVIDPPQKDANGNSYGGGSHTECNTVWVDDPTNLALNFFDIYNLDNNTTMVHVQGSNDLHYSYGEQVSDDGISPQCPADTTHIRVKLEYMIPTGIFGGGRPKPVDVVADATLTKGCESALTKQLGFGEADKDVHGNPTPKEPNTNALVRSSVRKSEVPALTAPPSNLVAKSDQGWLPTPRPAEQLVDVTAAVPAALASAGIGL